MPTCNSCGATNRNSARFCFNCAAPLPAFHPSADDHAWLVASLVDSEPPAATGTTGPLAPLDDSAHAAAQEEEMMEDNTTPPNDAAGPTLFAERYALSADAPAEGRVMVRDTQPWRQCWACGSTANEAGESFCMDCGAALEQRNYRGVLGSAGVDSGPALITTIDGEPLRAQLPEVWDHVVAGDRALTLLHDSGRTAIEVPLDETTALAVGLSLARLVAALHQRDMALGPITPADVEPLAGGVARLRDVPGLRRIPDDGYAAAVKSDLNALAELLEQLTATPRTTQRLDEDNAEAAEYKLPQLLRGLRTGTLTTAHELAEQFEQMLADRTRPTALRQLVGAATDTGIVRDHNEDSYFTLNLSLNNDGQLHGWGVYIVSDGMGGHAAGEVASGLAVRGAAEVILGEYLTRAIGPDELYAEDAARDLVRRAVLRANQAIIDEGNSQGNDMGATITMALLIGDRAIVGNVGDSRTYLYRDGKLRRISKDHSLVMRLVDLGQIADEDIYTHPQRNAVLRSLGDKSDVEVDVFSERMRPGDALLLCSDGQWEMTRDAEMERIIGRTDDPQRICADLISAANQAGGEDNIASVLVRFAE
ncbi:MAG: SpoIIE family protein phosphatase [Oscillochloris sp.]|nr:SpoIIE family protein phosphatase [Oscillochloris sp.]